VPSSVTNRFPDVLEGEPGGNSAKYAILQAPPPLYTVDHASSVPLRASSNLPIVRSGDAGIAAPDVAVGVWPIQLLACEQAAVQLPVAPAFSRNSGYDQGRGRNFEEKRKISRRNGRDHNDIAFCPASSSPPTAGESQGSFEVKFTGNRLYTPR